MSNANLHTCEKAAPGWQKDGECQQCSLIKSFANFGKAVERVQPEPALPRHVEVNLEKMAGVPSTSVEPQVEPSQSLSDETMERLKDIIDGYAINSVDADWLWRTIPAELAADSVSHPPLEQVAREWGNKDWEAIYLMVWKTLEPFNVRVSDVHRLTDQLAAFVRERSK